MAEPTPDAPARKTPAALTLSGSALNPGSMTSLPPNTPSFAPGTPLTAVPMPASARSSVAVGLNEAALDSPSFRASVVHFGEQIDSIERWLDNYTKSTSKLVHDFLAFEDTINNYLSKILPPPSVADGVIDADHTLLSLKRVSDYSKDWWAHLNTALHRLDTISGEPVRNFIASELRNFKDIRRSVDQAQKAFDTSLARYVSQSKTKEPSALREDAFAVYEARRTYLKTSMDYCQLAPQLRCNLDKLLTRVSSDFWREMRRSRDPAATTMQWNDEMERIRGWSKELDISEASLKRELQLSRRLIGESAVATFKPSRELDDYSASTVPFLGSRGPMNVRLGSGGNGGAVISEKQGWLFLRVVTGKPARVNWLRRWFYCHDGIFGWLLQGPHGVLQGDDIGVLLCSAKPAVQEERRFCFEIKTKSQNLMLQAETQGQLTEWLEVFEVAKKKALEASMARDNAGPGSVDPAFAITPPLVAEFSARMLDAAAQSGSADEVVASLERAGTLAIPGNLDPTFTSRTSFDVTTAMPRRSITMLGRELVREEGESSREHAARVMQKLDLHRKNTLAAVTGGGGSGNGNGNGNGIGSGNGNSGNGAGGGGSALGGGLPAQPQSAGGIAGLISAGHSMFPAFPSSIPPANQAAPGAATAASAATAPRPAVASKHLQSPAGSYRKCGLAPTTFTKSPISTFLSKIAVTASSERVLTGIGGTSCSLPAGILANYWGSNVWGSAFVANKSNTGGGHAQAPSPRAPGDGGAAPEPGSATPGGTHRKTQSVDAAKLAAGNSKALVDARPTPEVFPANYPAELRAQHAQFRLLFPSVPLREKLVLVFNAAWASASEEGALNQGLVGSGRIYVSADNMYFYSETMGLVVTYAVSLDIITEVTAAPGKDCDYIFLHLGQDMNETGFTRITIKTFLEDMYLLQARLNLLIDDLQAAEPLETTDMIEALQKLESEVMSGHKSPSVASWEEASTNTPLDNGTPHGGRGGRGGGGGAVRPGLRRAFDSGTGSGRQNSNMGGRGLGVLGRPAGGKVQLPSQPVNYEPDDMQKKVAERHFEISAKACFHVLFGDKSFIFAQLYSDRRAREITQGPWELADHGIIRRQFQFKVEAADLLGRRREETVEDEQTIDEFNDHVTYVVRQVKRAWHLPHSQGFRMVTKVVITHVAKSKCKLAIYTRVDWSKAPAFSKNLVERQALDDAGRDAEELAELATDEVRKLGPHSRTKRAIQLYGNIGNQTQAVVYVGDSGGDGHGGGMDGGTTKKPQIKPRTLTEMLLETLRSFMESVVTSLMMWAFTCLRKLWRVATAHRILLGVLALSLATNAVFSSRETAAWWSERHATQFMQRLGVGPNLAMSRSVYLVDLEEAGRGSAGQKGIDLNSNAININGSVCYDTFRVMANATDMDASFEDAGPVLSSATSRATARRLRRSRQKLGAYRHDLLVAMRIVNSVEREMLQSEWENWLADENVRCEQVRLLLDAKKAQVQGGNGAKTAKTAKWAKAAKAGKGGGSAKITKADDKASQLTESRVERLGEWYDSYCGSCRTEQRGLENAGWRQSML